MTTSRVEEITSGERRRRWPRAEKERLVALSLEPGTSASQIARSAGLHVSQFFRWRKQLCEQDPSHHMPGSNKVALRPFSALVSCAILSQKVGGSAAHLGNARLGRGSEFVEHTVV